MSSGERKYCHRRQRKPLKETLTAWITNITGISPLANAITGTHGIALQPVSSSGARTTSRPPVSNTGGFNAPSNSQAGSATQTRGTGLSITIPVGIANDLYIFFCVKGARRTLEVAQIDVHQQVDDKAFFDKIRTQYRHKRGFLRYWLSPWQLKRLRADQGTFYLPPLTSILPYELIFDSLQKCGRTA